MYSKTQLRQFKLPDGERRIEMSKTRNVGRSVDRIAGKVKSMGVGSFAAMAPFIFDIVGPLIAGQIRDGLSGDGVAKVKEWFSGDKISLENIQKALDLLPAEERVKIEAKLAELNEHISLIQHSTLSDDEKKRRIESVSRQYLKSVPGHTSSASAVPAPKDFGEVAASWSPEMHELQRRWFELLPEAEKTKYSENMAHLAPVLVMQLRPFLSEKEGQKRVSGLTDLESSIKGVSLERYKLWYRTMSPVERSAFASMANSKRLTARIVESVLELADVPAPKIPDFETFLDENKVRKSHDGFIRHLDPARRAEFRGFRDRLHPGMLKDKLSGIRWTPDVARDVYTELEFIARGTGGTVFDSTSATEVLDMVRGRLLDEPITDSPKPELDAEKALTIFRLIKSFIPKPKPTAGEKATELLKTGKDVLGKVDTFIKDLLPYEHLTLASIPSNCGSKEEYVHFLVQNGNLESIRSGLVEGSEGILAAEDAILPSDNETIKAQKLDKKRSKDKKFLAALLKDTKFMSKVDAKINARIRELRVEGVKGKK